MEGDDEMVAVAGLDPRNTQGASRSRHPASCPGTGGLEAAPCSPVVAGPCSRPVSGASTRSLLPLLGLRGLPAFEGGLLPCILLQDFLLFLRTVAENSIVGFGSMWKGSCLLYLSVHHNLPSSEEILLACRKSQAVASAGGNMGIVVLLLGASEEVFCHSRPTHAWLGVTFMLTCLIN